MQRFLTNAQKARYTIVFCLVLVFQVSGLLYRDNHSTADSLTSSWTTYGSRSWTCSVGYALPQASDGAQSLLINNLSCAADGTLETFVYSAGDSTGKNTGLVFRFIGQQDYYYAVISNDYNSFQKQLRLCKGTTDYSLGEVLYTFPNVALYYTFKIVLTGATFTFFVDDAQVAQKSDTTYRWGKFGYGQAAGRNGTKFDYISWFQSDSVPSFVTMPLGDTVIAGQPLQLLSRAAGLKPISFQWQKQDASLLWQNVSGATDSVYSIAATQSSHSGVYRVIASNSAGADTSSTAAVAVIRPATILTDPTDTSGVEGASVSFLVTASGDNALTYQWQSRPSPSGSWTVTGGGNAALSLSSINASQNNSSYRCIVSNTIFTQSYADTSAAATLTVLSGVKIISCNPASSPHQVKKATAVTFSVTAIGNPAPAYRWIRTRNSTIDTVSFSASHAIASADTSDNGFYRGRVFNNAKDTLSQSIELSVYIAPLITVQPRDTTVRVGDSASFSLTATGYPLRYQWQKFSGGWQELSGATSRILRFVTTPPDSATQYRCVVTAGAESQTSAAAALTIGMAPTILANLPQDTAMIIGRALTLTASVAAVPPPTYEWLFFHPSTPFTCVTKSTQKSCGLQLSKSDSGSIFFRASNSFATVRSDTCFIHVLDSVRLLLDLPRQYPVAHGASAVMSVQAAGDGVLAYQWFRNNIALPSQTTSQCLIPVVDSLIEKNSVYRCQIWNTFRGRELHRIASQACTLVITTLYNPFKIEVFAVTGDPAGSVAVKAWSDVGLAEFPAVKPVFPPGQWCDSLIIVYKTRGFASDTTNTCRFSLSTEAIKRSQPAPVVDTFTVAPLSQPHDSSYWFSHGPLWHLPLTPQKDTLVKPLIDASRVMMIKSGVVSNPLVIGGGYLSGTDYGWLMVKNLVLLDTAVHGRCRIIGATRKNPSLYDTSLTVAQMKENRDSMRLVFRVGSMPIETDTVTCYWSLYGRDSTQSAQKSTTFSIGVVRPVYGGTLTADSTAWSSQLRVVWDAPTGVVDSMRLWWDASPIVLHFDPKLPQSQAIRLNAASGIDTIEGFLGNTRYYLGVQICANGLWSVITEKSRTSAMTSYGDTTHVVNSMVIDSCRFNDTTNAIVAHGRIDLSTLPPQKQYQYGCSFSVDSTFLTSRPVQWFTLTSATPVMSVPLENQILFDTIMHAGFWLRIFSSGAGPGQPASPTVASTGHCTIGSFTWQVVRLSSSRIDTAYAANRSIVIHSLIPMDFSDTVRAYQPSLPLPVGFVGCGGSHFQFSQKKPQIPTIRIGMKPDKRVTLLIRRKSGIYRDIRSSFFVYHGLERADTIVWTAATKEDVAYPFVLCADTAAPVVMVSSFADTVTSGQGPLKTEFTIQDNVSNCTWNFLYGSGNSGYTKSVTGILTKIKESPITTIPDDPRIINTSFGLRAIMVVSDGVTSDTATVSRCVRTQACGAYPLNEKEWEPVSIAAGLTNNSLRTVFTNSLQMVDPWQYDPYRHRVYRWFSIDASTGNNWIEYNDEVSKYFSFEPGCVIWAKSGQALQLVFGQGVTPSLRQPFTLNLKSKNWTDAANPFQFDIALRDVLSACGKNADSLEVYHWVKSGGVYVPQPIYIPFINSLKNGRDTLHAGARENAYTFYNHFNHAVALVVPPICLPLSQQNVAAARQQDIVVSSGDWTSGIHWTEALGAGEQPLRTIYVGQSAAVSEPFFGPVPPSIGAVVAGVLDTTNSSIHGYALQKNSGMESGACFTLSFRPSAGSKGTRICYYPMDASTLPPGFSIRLFQPETGLSEVCDKSAPGRIDLASAPVQRVIAIGSPAYLEAVASHLANPPLLLSGVFPNPFKYGIVLLYTLPRTVSRLHVTLYDLRGRVVLDHSESVNFKNGSRQLSLPIPANRTLSAGMYIVRLQGFSLTGQELSGGQKKIVCVK
ncbi:MAG: T9SS type A sorting domain-containing protein [Chitinivibrionales bacterium]|nr:T9SS type A sorting domain-containing protein [Chitinivibrionales bacterium]